MVIMAPAADAMVGQSGGVCSLAARRAAPGGSPKAEPGADVAGTAARSAAVLIL
jgi:hypothetical protein